MPKAAASNWPSGKEPTLSEGPAFPGLRLLPLKFLPLQNPAPTTELWTGWVPPQPWGSGIGGW